MIAWACSFAPLNVAGVEGTGSYGAGLTRALRAADVKVIEVNRPDRATRRRRGKTDAVDAESAARAVLSGEATALAKSADGPVEDIRVLKVAKDSAVKPVCRQSTSSRRFSSAVIQSCVSNCQPSTRDN